MSNSPSSPTLPFESSVSFGRAGKRLHRTDVLLLFAIGVVVLLVSLPQLRGFARRTNEADARATLRLLGTVVFDPDRSAAWSGLDEVVRYLPFDNIARLGAGGQIGTLGRMLMGTTELEHRLQDARLVVRGQVLLFHGYYFELGTNAGGQPALFAWPRKAGSSGVGAYALLEDGILLGHPNRSGHWSGLERRISSASPAWLRLEG